MIKNNCWRRYQVWFDEEYDDLEKEYKAGWTIKKIMKCHGRNIGGISAALVRMGLIKKRKECYEQHKREINDWMTRIKDNPFNKSNQQT